MIGFIGLGDQGKPMARRILAAGLPLTIYARRDGVAAELERAGATIAGSAYDLGRRCGIVAICVVDAAGVEDVLVSQRLLEGLRPGSVVAVHSTVDPAACERFATVALGHGVTLIDAPVSGMARGASEGTLAVMVGGPVEAYERCLPMFRSYGAHIVRVGAIGAGQKAKLLNNLMAAANLYLAQQVIRFGDTLHIDPEALAGILSAGSAQTRMLQVFQDAGWQLDLGRPDGTARVHRTMSKDVGLALELLLRHGSHGADLGILARKALALLASDTADAAPAR